MEDKMKQLIAAICFTLAAMPVAFAQDKAKEMEKKAPTAMEKAPSTAVMKGTGEEKKSPEKASMERPKGVSEGSQKPKEPSVKQKAQQERMKDCSAQAGDRKGDDRKKFMSSCLKGKGAAAEKTSKKTPQQTKMGECNKEAKDKTLKGDERKKFMKECLSK
jgi:hypothetical protein